MPTSSYEDRLFKIMEAQRWNLQRIDTGVVLSGQSEYAGESLVGPPFDFLRMFDQLPRMVDQNLLASAHKVASIVPLVDASGNRIVGRVDRQFAYQVQMAVQLTVDERREDINTRAENSILGKKVDAMVHDWRRVFFDNLLLQTDDEPNGLVDDADYILKYVDMAYPWTLVVADVSAAASCV